MINHSTIYNSQEKQDWRNFVYSILTPKNCYNLVDKDGNFKYKWLEPIGTDALPFSQLLQTGRIKEFQLIGIDLDPKHKEVSIKNIENCKIKFPQAEFYAQDWVSYCKRCEHNDIGYFIFDLYLSTFGDSFEDYLKNTIKLIDRCKKNIGEVLLVINCDIGFAKRMNRGTVEEFAREIEKILKISSIESIRQTVINPETVYKYSGNKTDMATFVLVL